VIAWLVVGAGVLFLLVVSAGSALTNRRYHFRDGGVNGVIGVMGSGKSLFVVSRVMLPVAKALASRRGLVSETQRPVKRIIANFSADLGYPDVEYVVLDGARLWDHLIELAEQYGSDGQMALDALVVVDEAHLYLPSDKLRTAQKARYFCSMARKLNVEFWWITQNEMKINKRLRDDTTFIWQVQRFRNLFTLVTGSARWFQAEAFEPEHLRRLNTRRAVERRFYKLNKRVLRAYNSFELIVPDATADVSRDSLSGRPALAIVPLLRDEGAGVEPAVSSRPTAKDDDDTDTLRDANASAS